MISSLVSYNCLRHIGIRACCKIVGGKLVEEASCVKVILILELGFSKASLVVVVNEGGS